jgi:hypothetical protein
VIAQTWRPSFKKAGTLKKKKEEEIVVLANRVPLFDGRRVGEAYGRVAKVLGQGRGRGYETNERGRSVRT